MMFPILSGIRFLLPIVWPIDWSQYELRFRMGQNKSSIRGFVFNFTSLHSIPLCVHWIFEGQPIVVYNFEHNLFTIHFISGFFVQMFLLLYLYTKWYDNVECIFIWSGHCNTPYVVHTQMLVNEWISSLFFLLGVWCVFIRRYESGFRMHAPCILFYFRSQTNFSFLLCLVLF